jgi:predicted amidohydrolase YtcJ
MTFWVDATCPITAVDAFENTLSRPLARWVADDYLNRALCFLDERLGNRMVVVLQPYAEAQGDNARLTCYQEQIDAVFIALNATRFEIYIHGIGAVAPQSALNRFLAARHAHALWISLHHIMRCQMIAHSSLLVALGVVANLKPRWSGPQYSTRISMSGWRKPKPS